MNKEKRYKGKQKAISIMAQILSEQKTQRMSDENIALHTGFTRQHIRTTLNSWDGKLSTVCNIADALGCQITITTKNK